MTTARALLRMCQSTRRCSGVAVPALLLAVFACVRYRIFLRCADNTDAESLFWHIQMNRVEIQKKDVYLIVYSDTK